MKTTTKITVKTSDFKYVGSLELSNELYFELCESNQYIAAGTICNVGMIPHYLHPIDPDFSFDQNLQAFIENLQYKSEDATYQHPDLITDFLYSFE